MISFVINAVNLVKSGSRSHIYFASYYRLYAFVLTRNYTKFQTINGQQQPLSLDDLIRDWLKIYYNGDDAKIDYILSLYEIESSFEYDYSGVTAQDPQWFLTHYVYAIKMTLK